MHTPNISYTLVIRISVLSLLIVQTTSGVLLMRYSRLYNSYSSTLAVFYSEIVKTIILLLLFYKQNTLSFKLTWAAIKNEIIFNPKETIKLIVPGVLYSIQNNIIFIALSNLDAATFQITYQLKILTTSLISIWILGTHINKTKWVALITLMAGVILVQISQHKINEEKATESTEDSHEKSWLIGLGCVLFACISSPFAGVYYEKLVKTGAQCSIVIRNLQLAIFSLTFGFVGVLIEEGTNFFRPGHQFKNFDAIVWAIILIQGTGGLIVAAVVKYTDNIQKGFATSISIIISSLTSYFLLQDLVIEEKFLIGGVLVLISTIIYSMSGTKPPKDTEIISK
ncbi:UDP-N-acetylglucosamine transporter [Lepeophtheirus salmonis]|uniref:UDP-N-acetylglucosamine transporter n=1 Tax=Lepeophtheirus salmonis TaxID=72036 RepID=UPI001AE4DF2C|nr:UDP-N-acetylglucosamine transporter-like [Lepeophtheirus salmonis]XP_040581255.1 UDP-N-acetylglucosamine transporter-like [Lepeophtheirus salmonis]